MLVPYGMNVDVEWFDRGSQKVTVSYGDVKRFALVRKGDDLDTYIRILIDEVARIVNKPSAPSAEKEKDMSEKDYTNPSGAQIPGYRQQSQANLEVVKFHKEWEERTLRHLDWLREQPGVDQRWLQMGRSNIEVAFMEVNRAVMQPQRIALPEDAEPEKLAYNQKPPVHASQGGNDAQGSRAAGQGDHAKGDAEK